MGFDVVVLNGGSSSGKSAIGRALQDRLPQPWLFLGVDDLLAALPPGVDTGAQPSLIAFEDDGRVVVGEAFGRIEAAWYAGVAAMARAGVGVIVEDVFLGGRRSQERVRRALGELRVLWVGVRCDPDVAEGREAARADRTVGMARAQAELAHLDVDYDLEVDSGAGSPEGCARMIADRLA